MSTYDLNNCWVFGSEVLDTVLEIGFASIFLVDYILKEAESLISLSPSPTRLTEFLSYFARLPQPVVPGAIADAVQASELSRRILCEMMERPLSSASFLNFTLERENQQQQQPDHCHLVESQVFLNDVMTKKLQ